MLPACFYFRILHPVIFDASNSLLNTSVYVLNLNKTTYAASDRVKVFLSR
jgi:hypothetical protein